MDDNNEKKESLDSVWGKVSMDMVEKASIDQCVNDCMDEESMDDVKDENVSVRSSSDYESPDSADIPDTTKKS